jgi:hypothetical protein
MRRFLREWRIEIIMVAAVLLGIALVLERVQIRTILRQGLETVVQGLGTFAGTLADRIIPNTLSDALGIGLIVTVLILARWRLRWRLLNSPELSGSRCPQCGSRMHRIHRKPADKVISGLIVPVRRFECSSKDCRWTGLRVDDSKMRHRSGQA